MISQDWLTWISLATVGGFAAVGIRSAWGRIQSIDDYVTARSSTGAIPLSATLLASFLGVFILFTPPEAALLGGLPAIIGYAMGVIMLYWALMTLSPRIKSYLPEGSSLTDYAWARYGAGMHGLTLILSIFYMFVHLVAELTAIALVANQLAGIPLWQTATLVGLGTMAYTAYGGLQASMFTDNIQMRMTVILLAIMGIAIVKHLGGLTRIMAQTQAQVPELLKLSNMSGIQYGLTLMIAVLAANLFHQGYWQRVYAGRDDATIKQAFRLAIPAAAGIMLLAGLFGIVAAAFGMADQPSTVFFTMTGRIFPEWLILIVYLLALILVMSTVDTLLNATAATFTIDIKRVLPSLSQSKLLNLSRLLTVILIVPAIGLSSQGYSVLQLFLIADLVCAGAIFPLFYGLYTRHHNGTTALAAAVCGILAGIPLFQSGQLLLSFFAALGVSISISLIGGYLCSSRPQPAGK
jgi:Na+/proline symporter